MQDFRNPYNECEEFHTSGQYRYQDTCKKNVQLLITTLFMNWLVLLNFVLDTIEK